MAFLGIIVVIVLLVGSSTIGGAFCIKPIGCVYSKDGGLHMDRTDVVQIDLSKTTTQTAP